MLPIGLGLPFKPRDQDGPRADGGPMVAAMRVSGPHPDSATARSRILLLAALAALSAQVASLCGLVAARPWVALGALGLALLVTWRALDLLPREDLAGHDVRVTHVALAIALACDLLGVIGLVVLAA